LGDKLLREGDDGTRRRRVIDADGGLDAAADGVDEQFQFEIVHAAVAASLVPS